MTLYNTNSEQYRSFMSKKGVQAPKDAKKVTATGAKAEQAVVPVVDMQNFFVGNSNHANLAINGNDTQIIIIIIK